MRIILITATLLLAGLAGQDGDRVIPAVDPDRVKLELALDPSAILIDVRLKFEYRRRRIEKSVNLPKKADLDKFAEETPRHRPLYLYCTTETRARQAAALLVDHGFLSVYIMEGGLNKWRAYNLPLVKGRKGRYPASSRK
ncbi:MAG: rhodanese-like domain-containing protein [Bacteroidales bacterium]|jgi:rhodanese-related sulfurtransferase|nr:rhodanese-like domain-containing protein [Bacteroidales bacterium]